METLRKAARVLSLLALDFAGLLFALVVALMIKAVIREDDWAWGESLHEARRTIAFAYLVTVLLFARSGLYAERAQRPGLARIVTSLFQVMVVALDDLQVPQAAGHQPLELVGVHALELRR